MSERANTAATRLATRLGFFVAGFVMACWAPLVPFAKANTGVSEAVLGLLLLCLGVGSLIAMPLAGWISAQRGARPMILAGGGGLVLVLPALALASDPLWLGLALLVFGASLGTLDVAVNVHAVEIEKDSDRPLMSGFHAMFSVGGFVGAGGVTLLLSRGATPLTATIVASVLALVALVLAAPRLIRVRGGEPPALAWPRGIVLAIAVLTAIIFLVEGAILDWGALLLVGRGLMAVESAGSGYMIFAVAMTVGRLTGDRVVAVLGPARTLIWGGALAVAGIVVTLVLDWVPGTLAGFVLIGLGAANLVPVLFSLAGRQRAMPSGLAIAAVTTTGYAGILVGPAGVGGVAHLAGLPAAFWMLAALTAIVPLSARAVVRAV